MSESCDVAVLGAGPAGLAAALRLAGHGRSVVLVERAAHVGGLAASIEVAGQRVDLGSHRLHPTTSADVLGVLRDLLGDDLQTRPRRGRMRIGGRFVAFPPDPAELARELPRPLAARLAADAVGTPVRRSWQRLRAPGDDISFADVVRRTLGPTMLHEFYGPYAQKLWGVPAEQLSAELARRRVSARGPSDLVRKALRREPTRGVFLYPRRGFGQITEALAEACAARGVRILLRESVTAVVPSASGVQVTTGSGRHIDAGHAVSTLPLGALLAAMPDAGGAGAGLSSRGMALVYLVVPQPEWTPFDAHYLPALDTIVARVSEPKRYRVDGDDPTDRTVLCAEVPCTAGDACWSLPDAVLAERVAAELAAQGLPAPPVAGAEVVRLPAVYPLSTIGFERALGEAEALVAASGRVLTIGRLGAFAHDNSHHALEQGFSAADALATGVLNERGWDIARARFRDHVVED